MRRLYCLILIFLFCSTAIASVNKISEEDGSPSGFPWSVKFSNGAVTDNGDGTFSVSTGGGGGTPGGSDTQVQYNNAGAFGGASGLVYDDVTGNVGIGTTSPARLFNSYTSTALTNSVSYNERMTHITSGTPANGIGVGLEFEQETTNNNYEIGAVIETTVSDVTGASEDFDLSFKTMTAGAAADAKMSIKSPGYVEIGSGAGNGNALGAGELYVQGDLEVDGTIYGASISGVAPSDATYITQTANGTLSNEQALSSLSTGLMQVTTSTGVVSSVTTSAGISGLLSDETGSSGALVFATGPTISSPVITNIAPGANFTLTQNSVTPFVSVATSAAANTLYLSQGNVGIGTLSPTHTFEVNGDGFVGGSYSGLFQINRGAGEGSSILTFMDQGSDAWYFGMQGGVTDFSISEVYPNQARFVIQDDAGTGSANQLYLRSGGNVGIGSTAPSRTLDVAGDINSSNNIRISNAANFSVGSLSLYLSGSASVLNSNSTAGSSMTVTGGASASSHLDLISTSGSGSSDYIKFQVGNAGATEVARMTTGGNVGIGTTSPGKKLEVSGATQSTDYYSGDGTQGATTTCTIASITTITVKDGLITACA